MNGEHAVDRNFILKARLLQWREKKVNRFKGATPASFRLLHDPVGKAATSIAGRVAPVDSGLWWIILLRAYKSCRRFLTVRDWRVPEGNKAAYGLFRSSLGSRQVAGEPHDPIDSFL